jgi:hypothetical protein
MALRSGHGNGAGQPRIEVLPVDELPAGLPASAGSDSPTDRGQGGRFAPGNKIASAGGHARAGKTRLADRLGLATLPAGNAFAPYRASAVTFRRAQCATLAATVGGGVCGAAPSSLIATAALQLAWSRFLSDRAALTGDPSLAMTASRLGDASRQSLLAAHELCAREGQARAAAAPPTNAFERLVTALAEPAQAAALMPKKSS